MCSLSSGAGASGVKPWHCRELQYLGNLTHKLPFCREVQAGSVWERRGRREEEERICPLLSSPRGAAFRILMSSLESFLVEPIIPAATHAPQRALTIHSAEAPSFYLYLKLSLSTQWEQQWKEQEGRRQLCESVCVRARVWCVHACVC